MIINKNNNNNNNNNIKIKDGTAILDVSLTRSQYDRRQISPIRLCSILLAVESSTIPLEQLRLDVNVLLTLHGSALFLV